jgi:predicted RNase H-like HicB family nuclease
MASKKRERIKYIVTLREAEEGGYTVEVPALPGCISEGSTYEEALSNIREAIQAYLEDLIDEMNPHARVLITEVEVELPSARPAAHAR